MYLASFPNGGRDYWMVVRGVRTGAKVRQERPLYLGRLDNLTPQRLTTLERQILALHDDKLLHTFYAKLAEHGHPVPRPASSTLLVEDAFSLPSVDFSTLCEALRLEDLTARDLAALLSRMGHPVRAEELAAISVRLDLPGKKRSISLFYPRTSSHPPTSAPPATAGLRPRRGTTGRSRASLPR